MRNVSAAPGGGVLCVLGVNVYMCLLALPLSVRCTDWKN